MDEGSTTIALTTRIRKRSISSHRHSTTDNDNRTLIKTKIQKIDGQYKASPTCPINNEQEQTNSSDDQDEPLIVATVPPLVQNSSKYRTRQDIYDDETGDDQQSNASSTDYSPIHQSESPSKTTIITIQKSSQLLNDNGNETTNETSVHIPTMSTKRSTRLLSEENNQEESVQQRTKITKKFSSNKSSVSNSSTAISIEQNQTNNSITQSSSPVSTITETRSITEDIPNKSTTPIDVNVSNNKQSQNINDQSKVKVRLKPIPPSLQTKKNNNPVTTIKNTKPVEQKPIKKPMTLQKETVITIKKTTTTTTIIPKKPIKTSIIKSLSNTNNSEKQSVRPPITKSTEKKSSDISNSTITITKKSTEPPPAKPPPVTLGKIPKLNPANKQKPTETPKSSQSLTDQKSDLPASGGASNNTNKESNTSEKNLPKHRSPQRSNRPQQNSVDNSDPFAPLSPMDYVDHMDNSFAKQSSTRYPSLLDNNPRLTSSFSRTNSIGLDNTQSQSPLSPGPSSTLYPPPSPPVLLPPPPLLPPSRSIPPSIKPFIDSRNNQPHLLPPINDLSQSFNRKTFSTPPVLSRPSSSSTLTNTQSIHPPPLMSNDYQDPWTTSKSNNIWDSASSDEEPEDETNARRFFHQNMRAVDEELSKLDEPHTTTSPLAADIRTEQLLKRQKKASLGLATNGGIYEENIVETSASVDDFECVAMDLDSPKHRTQSESSDNNHTIVESNNGKNTTNGPADSKNAELTTASSMDTSKKLLFKNRPLKTTSMTLIDELKNSINPSSTSKPPDLSPPSRSVSRSRTRSRSRSRTRTRSQSRSRSRTRSRSRSRSSSSSSSSSSHKRHSRSRHRSSKRRSNKHHQRRRSTSYDDTNERMESNTNNYPPAPMHYPSHHHHPHPHPHHQQHWPSARQTSGLLTGPPPLPPQSYGHQQPVPPLLPNHPYYPPSTRSLMHPVESANAGGRFNFQHNSHQRHHPPLMHAPYYAPAPLQPLMQSASRSHHHPINRYPPPVRPFDLPPHPMAMGNPGPYPPNSNYNQFKFESEEHLAIRRAKTGTNTNNPRRGGSQQTEPNGKKKINNPSKSNSKPSEHQEMDQLFLEREKLLAELNEITDSGEIDEDHASKLRSLNPPKSINSQEDEGEEGEISESD